MLLDFCLFYLFSCGWDGLDFHLFGMIYLPPIATTCRSPPKIPEIQIPEKTLLQIVSAITFEINRALVVIRDIASGKDLKQFLSVCLLPSCALSFSFSVDGVGWIKLPLYSYFFLRPS